MIEIDGGEGEGGGQVIRTAMALSSITKTPIRISNIRAKRPKPGLRMQHLTAVRAVRNICRGTLEGAELGSSELIFHPGEIVGGRYDFNIGTAGSVTLVAQTLIPILLFAEKKSEISIIGGTHVIKSPSSDYFEKVFLPAINNMGVHIECSTVKAGYYPQGDGELRVTLSPSKIFGAGEWHSDDTVRVLIRLSNIPKDVGIREKKIFVQNNIENVRIFEEKCLDPGNALLAWRGFNGAYVLGEKGKRAEVVAQEALNQLNAEKYDVDKHLADQLLLYAALAEGATSFKTSEITEHFRTNLSVISKFVKRKIDLDGNTVSVE